MEQFLTTVFEIVIAVRFDMGAAVIMRMMAALAVIVVPSF
jgi:hypothetical protein